MGINPGQLVDECIEAGAHPIGLDPTAALEELHVGNLR